MEIHGDRPLDPAPRRRQADAARGQRSAADSARTSATGGAAGAAADATFSPGDSASVARMVGVLRNMSPADVHKVDKLKERIANGSYSADPEELTDLLLGQAAPRGPAQR